MAEQYVYCIRDNVAEESGPLFHAPNDGVAWRNFVKALENAVTPDDYSLYLVGLYDPANMALSSHVPYLIERDPEGQYVQTANPTVITMTRTGGGGENE
jgi:hypothetical protein